MSSATITISGKGVQDLSELDMQISVEAVVDVDANSARKQATAWLVSEVGNMLMAGNPKLVISQNTVWRLPVLLTSSSEGIIGEVGFVDVDGSSGEPLVSHALKTQILDNVKRLISPALSSTG